MKRTIGSTLDDANRGQVGIGTLIIFIALVLVAAVAAGVLINTAGLLESRASDTGEDAQAQVSNQIDVVSATGNVDGGTVDTVNLTVKKSAGSDAIDLKDATIEYVSNDEVVTLTYNGSSAGAGNFTTTAVSEGAEPDVLSDTGQRVKIEIDVSAIEGSGLDAGEDAEVKLVSQGGATTIRGINVPEVLADKSKTPV
jgi:flagellin-like protein